MHFCRPLQAEIGAESGRVCKFIIDREIEAPERFQAIQSYRCQLTGGAACAHVTAGAACALPGHPELRVKAGAGATGCTSATQPACLSARPPARPPARPHPCCAPACLTPGHRALRVAFSSCRASMTIPAAYNCDELHAHCRPGLWSSWPAGLPWPSCASRQFLLTSCTPRALSTTASAWPCRHGGGAGAQHRLRWRPWQQGE